MSDTKQEVPSTGVKSTEIKVSTPPATDAPAAANTNANASGTTTATTTATSNETAKPVDKPKSKGFSNPALRAMGIPTLRLPSRNWMIFWLVVSAGAGGVIYDKYQQAQIRKKWMKKVESLGNKPLEPNQLARKVTVYVAPPPSDYLDESMSIFRHYVKPILNAGGVDFTIQSENRQGVIRSVVAAEIRALRREILENKEELAKLQASRKWYNRVKSWFSKKSTDEAQEKELLSKQKQNEFDYSKLLGVYYENKHIDQNVVNEDSEVVEQSANGGIICIGRGAYKEYLTGLHEGLLGPLDKPVDHDEMEQAKTGTEAQVEEAVKSAETETLSVNVPVVQDLNDFNKTDESKQEDTVNPETPANAEEVPKIEEPETKEEEEKKEEPKEELDENGEKLLPVPKPFISPEDYQKAQLAPEFDFNSKIPTKDSVAPIFQQAIVVIPVYHLLGFFNTPQRIYRYYTKRYLTEEYGRATAAVVENLRSPFKLDHVDLAKDEESDWSKKWVQKGIENNSEWVQELKTDERVLSKLTVFDPEKVSDPATAAPAAAAPAADVPVAASDKPVDK